jgi:hypothetical protein
MSCSTNVTRSLEKSIQDAQIERDRWLGAHARIRSKWVYDTAGHRSREDRMGRRISAYDAAIRDMQAALERLSNA